MITQLAPAMARVSVQARPEDLFLGKGSWVQFSKAWVGDTKWVAGKLFQVIGDPIVVPFPMSWIIPGGDYVDVNLANLPTGFAFNQLNLYPNNPGVIYQVGIGIQRDDFFVQLGIPSPQKYIYNLGQAFMFPDISNANLKYLGQKTWRDSPVNAPLWFLYFIYNNPYVYFRIYALEGKDFEKCRIVFWVNKCGVQEIPNPTPDMQNKALYLPWYEELTKY